MIKYLYPALVAGLITGFVVTLFNLFFVQPLIVEAELLELHSAGTAHEHFHNGGEDSSLINERNFLTLLVNIAMSVAFSLMVIGFYYIRGGTNDARNLLKITFTGFFIFFLLPKDSYITSTSRTKSWEYNICSNAMGLHNTGINSNFSNR